MSPLIAASGLRRLSRLVASAAAAALCAGAVVVGGPEVAQAGGTPVLSAGGVRIVEPGMLGDRFTGTVPVVLSQPAPTSVSFTWSVTADPTRESDSIVPASGTGTIPKGGQLALVSVPLVTSAAYPRDELGYLTITGATGATVDPTRGEIRVREGRTENGTPTTVYFGDVWVPEPDTGSVTVPLPVTIRGDHRKDISVRWTMQSQYSAVAGVDATPMSGTAKFGRSGSLFSVPFTVVGDTTPEAWESVLVKPVLVSGPKGTSVPDPTAQVVVPRNDSASALDWQPPASVLAGPGTVIHAESDAADWIGQGRPWTWTNADAVVQAADDMTRSTGMSGDGDDDVSVALPYLTAPGSFTDLGRFSASATMGAAGCNESRTTLVVDRLTRDAAGELTALTARLEQFCDDRYGPLHLFLRYDRGDPTAPPPLAPPTALAWVPPGGALPPSGSAWYSQSSPGEWVGQGLTELVTTSNATWSRHDDGAPLGLWLRLARTDGGEDWSIWVAMPLQEDRWKPGSFPVTGNANRNPTKGYVDLSRGWRGCNAMTGTMAVDSAAFDDVGLATLQARMVVSCDGGEPLRAALRYVR